MITIERLKKITGKQDIIQRSLRQRSRKRDKKGSMTSTTLGHKKCLDKRGAEQATSYGKIVL